MERTIDELLGEAKRQITSEITKITTFRVNVEASLRDINTLNNEIIKQAEADPSLSHLIISQQPINPKELFSSLYIEDITKIDKELLNQQYQQYKDVVMKVKTLKDTIKELISKELSGIAS